MKATQDPKDLSKVLNIQKRRIMLPTLVAATCVLYETSRILFCEKSAFCPLSVASSSKTHKFSCEFQKWMRMRLSADARNRVQPLQ